MKITSQTAEVMVVSDGNTATEIFGWLLALAGVFVFYRSYVSPGFSGGLWAGAALIIFGILILAVSASITVRFDKTQNQIVLRKKRFWGTQTETYNLADAARVESRRAFRMEAGVQKNQGAAALPREVMDFQAVLVLSSGQALPLENPKSSSGIMGVGGTLVGGQGGQSAAASQVAAFLNIPFQESGSGATLIRPPQIFN